jgi:hypothetical protein
MDFISRSDAVARDHMTKGADRRAIGAHIAAMKASEAVNSIAMSARLRPAWTI